MSEPHASEFRRLIREGAGARDIHGIAATEGFAACTRASDAFIAREVNRVDTHLRGTCSLLEAFAGRTSSILDVGCSTGGSAVAMALSPILAPDLVVGIDPEPLSLRAAEVRARAYGLVPSRVAFRRTAAGLPLPFRTGSFDLVTCISVLEFVPTTLLRQALVDEMKRVVRHGGHIFLATPSPLRLRELHSKRWFGNLRRRDGYPWATPPRELRAMVSDCDCVPIHDWVTTRALERVGLPFRRLPAAATDVLEWASPWQKILARKPAA